MIPPALSFMRYVSSAVLRVVWCVFLCGAFTRAAIGAENFGEVLIVNGAGQRVQVEMMLDDQEAWNHNRWVGSAVLDPGELAVGEATAESLSGTLGVWVGAAYSTYAADGATIQGVLPLGSSNYVYRGDDDYLHFSGSGAVGDEGYWRGGLTNWGQFTNSAQFLPGMSETLDFVRGSVVDNDNFFTNGGYLMDGVVHWANKTLVVDGGSKEWTNSLDWSGFQPSHVAGSWIQADLPGLVVGSMQFRDWSFTCDPVVPGGLSDTFELFCLLCRTGFSLLFAWSLWWFIKEDIEGHLLTLASIPQATSEGTSVFGWKLGFVGQAIAAAAVCAALYVFVSKLVSHVVGVSSLGDISTSLGVIRGIVETGSGSGFSSGWFPRVTEWVGQVFPFVDFFASIATYVAYQFTKWPAVKLAVALLKFAQGFL